MPQKTIQTPYTGDNEIDRVLANIYEILNDLYKEMESNKVSTEGFTGIIIFVE